MKLGFLTAPFPETPLMEVADWAASVGFEVLEIACWPRSSGATRKYAGTSHIDVDDLSDARASEIRAEIAAKGLDISGLGFYPNPLHPDPAKRAAAIDHLKKVIVATGRMGLPVTNTFCGGDASQARRCQLGGGAAGLAGHRALRAGPRRQDHLRELPHDLQLRRVAGGAQHRLLALHLAAHPGGSGAARSASTSIPATWSG